MCVKHIKAGFVALVTEFQDAALPLALHDGIDRL
jgi:hypothetical protein